MGELVLSYAPMALMFSSVGCLVVCRTLGETVVEKLLQDWLALFLTAEEQEGLTDWHKVVNLKPQSLQCFWPLVTNITGSFDAAHQLVQ